MEENAQAVMNNIILCIDGEEGTKKAIRYAIEITRAFNGMLTALNALKRLQAERGLSSVTGAGDGIRTLKLSL